MKQPQLSIIIPAYNEEKRILTTLQDYTSHFDRVLKNDYEIFVVINGSTDATATVVRKFAQRHPTVRYVDLGKIKGKGNAIMYGFKHVNGKFIGFTDADDSTPARTYYDLYRNIGHHDGIIASRWIRGAIVTPTQPPLRRIASRCFNILVRLFFLLPFADTQNGAKLFTRKAIKTVIPSLGITQWAFDIDLLYHLKKHGFWVIEIPSEWHDDPNSHLRVPKVSLEMFLSIVRLRLIYSPCAFIVTFYDAVVGFCKRV